MRSAPTEEREFDLDMVENKPVRRYMNILYATLSFGSTSIHPLCPALKYLQTQQQTLIQANKQIQTQTSNVHQTPLQQHTVSASRYIYSSFYLPVSLSLTHTIDIQIQDSTECIFTIQDINLVGQAINISTAGDVN